MTIRRVWKRGDNRVRSRKWEKVGGKGQIFIMDFKKIERALLEFEKSLRHK
jgi:predicted DNA-binding WGR domain protein